MRIIDEKKPTKNAITQLKTNKNIPSKNNSTSDQEDHVMQMMSASDQNSNESELMQLMSKSNGGSNQKMPDEVQAKMENSMGTSFSDVNIHEDSSKAKDMGSLAYAQGNNVHFAPGQYNPTTNKGQQLLGHELAHVVQQRQGRVDESFQIKGVTINNNPALEQEADQAGKKAAEGEKVNLGTAPNNKSTSNVVQRFEAPHHEGIARVALGEDAKFSQMEATAVYYGNWMRDVNQVFVPALIDTLGADTLYSMLTMNSYKKFGKMPTQEQLGFYIPAEHLDSPAGAVKGSEYSKYVPKVSSELANQSAVNPEGAKPVPESAKTKQKSTNSKSTDIFNDESLNDDSKIFDVDQHGIMAYMHRSFEHLENRLVLAAKRGRNEDGMLHCGAAMHVVDDLFAHSNFVEIALEKVLKEKHNISDMDYKYLPQFDERHRDIQTFSRNVVTEEGDRPIMTTGSFSSGDTTQSIGHEFLHILREPPQRSSEEEIQQKFLFYRTLGNYIDKNQNLKKLIASEVSNSPVGVPGIGFAAASTSYGMIINTLIKLKELLSFKMFQELIYKIDVLIYNNMSLPLSNELEAAMLEARVRDTSLITVYDQNKDIASGKKSALTPLDEMMNGPFTNQIKELNASEQAKKRLDYLEQTPESVIAGPTHTQITKDHTNSVFFGLAYQLAVDANKIIRDELLKIWGDKQAIVLQNQKKIDPVSAMFGGRKNDKLQSGFNSRHHSEARESLNVAGSIYSNGYDSESRPNLDAHDAINKEKLSTLAQVLRGVTAISKDHQSAYERLQQMTGYGDGLKLIPMQIESLDELATDIENLNLVLASPDGKTHHVREQVYLELIDIQNRLVEKFKVTSNNYLEFPQKMILENLMERVTASLAPSFSQKQRDVLDQNDSLKKRSGGAWTKVQSTHIEKSKSDSKGAAYQPLIEAAREVTKHPYDSTWWHKTVTEYILRHPKEIQDSIIARNIGIASFKKR